MSSVVLALPKKLQSQPEGALSPECTSQMTRIFPNNVSSVSNSAYTLTAAAAAAGSAITFPVQEIRFSVPCGMGKHVFIDTSKSRLNFRVKYTTTASVSATDRTWQSNLISSAYSWFDRIQTINSNGQAIDDVVGLGQIMAHRNNYEFDAAERDSMWQYGFLGEASTDGTIKSVNNLQGHNIENLCTSGAAEVPDATYYYDYSVPLPSSLLGLGARNFCPIGALQSLGISLWTPNTAPIVWSVDGAIGTTQATIQLTMDNISVDLQYIYLDNKSAALLNLGKEYYIHSITNRLSTGVVASGTTGQVSTLIGLRGRSVRALSARFSESAQTLLGSVSGVYDSKLLPATQLNFFLGGKDRFPNVSHSSLTAPSTVFDHALQAAEAFSPDKTKYGGTFDNFCACFAGTDDATGLSRWVKGAGTSTIPQSLCAFSLGEDLRVASSSVILDGYDMSQSASHFLELNIPEATTNGINVSFISAQDIIYVVDLTTGNIEARV